MELIKRITNMRENVKKWFNSMNLKDMGFGIYTNSSYNQIEKNESMYLPATYNAGHCLKLIGAYENITEEEKSNLVNFLNSHQEPSGFFKMPGMVLEDLYYPSFEYDDFHITNYALGLLDSLGAKPKYDLNFLKDYNSPRKLDKWLSKRDLKNPWAEGNYVVNLASFYIYKIKYGKKNESIKYSKLLKRLVVWHNSLQDPRSGYWCEPETRDLMSAMAGASHNFHIYYYLNLPVPNYKTIIDHCLTIPCDEVLSACLDIDVVDILTNMSKYGYRVEDIHKYLRRKLIALLDYQNEDGGFSDVSTGTRFFDGWSVYQEPQGISNCFATWFRCAAIGMISCTLFKETMNNWHFRNTIGMGYFNKSYMENGFDEKIFHKYRPPKPKKKWVKGNEKKVDIDLSAEPGHMSVLELAEMTAAKMNEKDLTIFDTPKILAFKVLENEGYFSIEVNDGKAGVISYKEGSYDLLVTISIKNLTKVIQGRLMPVVAYGLKKLKLEGDITLGLKLQNLF